MTMVSSTTVALLRSSAATSPGDYSNEEQNETEMHHYIIYY